MTVILEVWAKLCSQRQTPSNAPLMKLGLGAPQLARQATPSTKQPNSLAKQRTFVPLSFSDTQLI